jgi:hypothetical protein
MRLWPTLAMVGFLAGCMTATEVEETAVDKAPAPALNPDTIHVGEEGHALVLACSPQLALCIAKVRGLTWAVHPASVARISGYEVGQVIRIQGVSPGRAWVVAMGQAGGDSSALTVIP